MSKRRRKPLSEQVEVTKTSDVRDSDVVSHVRYALRTMSQELQPIDVNLASEEDAREALKLLQQRVAQINRQKKLISNLRKLLEAEKDLSDSELN